MLNPISTPVLSIFNVYFPCSNSPSTSISPSFSSPLISGSSAVVSTTSIKDEIIAFKGNALLGTEKLSPL